MRYGLHSTGNAAPQIKAGEAHIWVSLVPRQFSPHTLAHYASLLDDSERERYDKIVHAGRKNEFLATRALARTILAKYTSLAPRMLHFLKNKYGKPALDPALGHNALQFNLSNTDDLVAIAVCRDAPIGIDVERIDRNNCDLDYEKWFAAEEVTAILGACPEHRRERFFEFWTLKEAFLKAVGTGLSTPLKSFAVDLRSRQDIGISISPSLAESASDWHLWLMQPTDRHLLSVVMQRRCPAQPEIRVCRIYSNSEIIA